MHKLSSTVLAFVIHHNDLKVGIPGGGKGGQEGGEVGLLVPCRNDDGKGRSPLLSPFLRRGELRRKSDEEGHEEAQEHPWEAEEEERHSQEAMGYKGPWRQSGNPP